MNRVSIFDYGSYLTWLGIASNQHLSQRKRALSLTLTARRLGYRSPRTFAMVVKGQRLPSAEMIFCLSREFGLTATEKRYFELLVFVERNKRKGRSTATIQAELDALRPRSSHRLLLDIKAFSFIAEWYHLVIKQLAGCRGFAEDPDWIRARLGNKVTKGEASRALENLIALGVLARNNKTGKLEIPSASGTSSEDVPSAAIKLHHKGMIDRAKEAIDEVDVSSREITSLTLRVDPSRMAEIKAMIREFRDEFDKRFSSSSVESVHQLNVQFFSHTKEKGL